MSYARPRPVRPSTSTPGGPRRAAFPLPDGEALFRRVAASNRAAAEPLAVPADYPAAARAYADAAPAGADGEIIRTALDREPRFHRGGWVLRLQPGARAMTLDTDIFVAVDRSLPLQTYVHELVHVEQYGRMGPLPFLRAYFSGSSAEILRRLARRQPLDPMTASALETDAYDLAARFTAWHRA